MVANCLVDSTRLAKLLSRYRTVEILSVSTVKHVRPHLRSVQIKFGKQRKSHFSQPSALKAFISRETCLDDNRMAVPSQIHAHSKIVNTKRFLFTNPQVRTNLSVNRLHFENYWKKLVASF